MKTAIIISTIFLCSCTKIFFPESIEYRKKNAIITDTHGKKIKVSIEDAKKIELSEPIYPERMYLYYKPFKMKFR